MHGETELCVQAATVYVHSSSQCVSSVLLEILGDENMHRDRLLGAQTQGMGLMHFPNLSVTSLEHCHRAKDQDSPLVHVSLFKEINDLGLCTSFL